MRTKEQVAVQQHNKYIKREDYYRRKAQDSYYKTKNSCKVSVEHKKCPSCLVVLPADDFHKASHHQDGLRTYCKKCTRELNRNQWNKHRKIRLIAKKEYWCLNREELLIKRSQWAKANRPILNSIERHRYSKLRASGGDLNEAGWSLLLKKYGDSCLCCSSNKVPTIDHIIPVSKGGKHIADNVQPLCRTCNSKKGVKIIDYRYAHRTTKI